MRRVYIVNRSPHDFSRAERFGRLVYLSDGSINRFSVSHMARLFKEALVDSEPSDYLVLCSLNVMNAVASGVFAAKHKRLNLLLYKRGDYEERNIVL